MAKFVCVIFLISVLWSSLALAQSSQTTSGDCSPIIVNAANVVITCELAASGAVYPKFEGYVRLDGDHEVNESFVKFLEKYEGRTVFLRFAVQQDIGEHRGLIAQFCTPGHYGEGQEAVSDEPMMRDFALPVSSFDDILSLYFDEKLDWRRPAEEQISNFYEITRSRCSGRLSFQNNKYLSDYGGPGGIIGVSVSGFFYVASTLSYGQFSFSLQSVDVPGADWDSVN